MSCARNSLTKPRKKVRRESGLQKLKQEKVVFALNVRSQHDANTSWVFTKQHYQVVVYNMEKEIKFILIVERDGEVVYRDVGFGKGGLDSIVEGSHKLEKVFKENEA